MVNQPLSSFCNSRVNAFASVVKIGLVCLPRFTTYLFPQLCSADVLAVSTASSSFALVCLAGLPLFRLTATLFPTGLSACTLGKLTLVCFDMVGSALALQLQRIDWRCLPSPGDISTDRCWLSVELAYIKSTSQLMTHMKQLLSQEALTQRWISIYKTTKSAHD